MMIRSTLAILAVLAPCLALAAANPVDLQKKARARMKSLDFEAALPLLEQVRDLPGLEAPLKAQVLVDLGITFVNLGRADDARKAFDEALDAQADVAFPSGVPPKIRRLFDEAKEARVARLAPKPEPVAPPPKPEPPVAEVKPAPPPPPVAVVAPPPPVEAKPRMVLLPAVLAGAGLLTLGAGVSTALAAQNADRKLSGSLHSSSDAQRLLGNRSTYGLASYVCYGAGAALLATAAALFVFSGSSGTSASAVLTPDGAAVAVRGVW